MIKRAFRYFILFGSALTALLEANGPVVVRQDTNASVCLQLLLPFYDRNLGVSADQISLTPFVSHNSQAHFFRVQRGDAYFDFSIPIQNPTRMTIHYMENPARLRGEMSNLVDYMVRLHPEVTEVQTVLVETNYAVFSGHFHRQNELYESTCMGGQCSSEVLDSIGITPYYRSLGQHFPEILDFRFDPEDHYLMVVLGKNRP